MSAQNEVGYAFKDERGCRIMTLEQVAVVAEAWRDNAWMVTPLLELAAGDVGLINDLPDEKVIDLDSMRSGNRDEPGSDRWLNVRMNFANELEGLNKCRANFDKETQYLPCEQRERLYLDLRQRLLRSQWKYFLSEFGCDKFLALQPPHESLISQDQGLYRVSWGGLRQFGDQSARYIEADEDVGLGLQYVYGGLWGKGIGAGAGVMSPTEKYRSHDSTIDVVDLMFVFRQGNGVAEVTGQYLVLDQVLSTEERRFIHNLFGLLNDHLTIEDIARKSHKEVCQLVSTDYLQAGDERLCGEGEVEMLVKRPNVFKGSGVRDESEIYDFDRHLDQIFEIRFGRHLINQMDIAMYPVINQLVNLYEEQLTKSLLDENESEYLGGLRELFCYCQVWWQILQEIQKISLNHDSDNCEISATEILSSVEEHMWDIRQGLIMVGGFEIMDDGGERFGTDQSSNVFEGNRYQTPWGFEKMKKYCQTHKKLYEGSHCPECKKKKEVSGSS
jgi:hypothetical protein